MTETNPCDDADMLSFATTSHQLAVRELLADLMDGLVGWGYGTDALAQIELVVAEALNNVFEHACGYEDGVPFGVAATRATGHLVVEITDQGNPMPGLELPKQALPSAPSPDVDVPLQALPEGGWGWMLIRELTDDMRYERRETANHLKLSIPVS